jgi:serine/threonine-protein kinase
VTHTLSAASGEDLRQEIRSVASAGVYVPADPPQPVGSKVWLRLVRTDGTLVAAAEAVVSRHGGPDQPRGMQLRVTRWENRSPTGSRPVAVAEPSPAPRSTGERTPQPGPKLGLPPGHQKTPLPIARRGSGTFTAVPTTGSHPQQQDRPITSAGSKSGDTRPPSGSGSADSRPRTPQSAKPDGAGTGLRPFDVLGSYQILKRLGGGGMADVYMARAELSQGVDKLVALKTVLAQFGPSTPYGSMFLSEARISATLQHPNLVQVFAVGESAGQPYLAMEYIHGRDLSAVLKYHKSQKTPPSVAFCVAVAVEVCKALAYVHEKKDLDGRPLDLVHRDISPANVLLSPRSEVKLMDFGVAAVNAEGGLSHGLMIGKAEYMPLEQAIGGKPAPHWDLFSLSVVLYELLTLRRPYPKVAAAEFVQTRRTYERIPPRDYNRQVPPALSALCLQATHPDPEKRFQSAHELQRALEEIQAEVGPCDVGAEIHRLFGPQLDSEEQEHEQLMAEARRRAERRLPAFLLPILPPLRALRRKVAGSRVGVELARRPALRMAVVGGLVLALGGTGVATWRSVARAGSVKALISQADAQLKAGRLVGPAGDEALGRLLAAKALAPDDPGVRTRLSALADKFEELAGVALQRGNRPEAAAHLTAAVQADPSREAARERLSKLEAEIRDSFKGRVVRPDSTGPEPPPQPPGEAVP